jgi:hypothetical protein
MRLIATLKQAIENLWGLKRINRQDHALLRNVVSELGEGIEDLRCYKVRRDGTLCSRARQAGLRDDWSLCAACRLRDKA